MSQSQKFAVLVVTVVAVLPAAGAPKLQDPPPPPTPLEGRWVMARLAYEETDLSESDASWVVIFTRTSMGVEKGGRSLWSQTMKARGSDSKGEFDVEAEDGVWIRGRWKLEGDVLMLCQSKAGEDRPTDFTSPAGSKRFVWVLKPPPKK